MWVKRFPRSVKDFPQSSKEQIKGFSPVLMENKNFSIFYVGTNMDFESADSAVFFATNFAYMGLFPGMYQCMTF